LGRLPAAAETPSNAPAPTAPAPDQLGKVPMPARPTAKPPAAAQAKPPIKPPVQPATAPVEHPAPRPIAEPAKQNVPQPSASESAPPSTPAAPRPDLKIATPPESDAVSGQQMIDVTRVDSNPAQPRQDFDEKEMLSLSESLSTHGLLQPIVVRRVEDRFQLIAGERRFRAAMEAGWTEVPANVVEADDRQTAEMAIIENLQRKDLNALEKAASFKRYLQQYECTQEELARRLSIDRSTIANLIRLLELPDPVRQALREGRITQGHARALLPLGDEPAQIEFCRRIAREGLNVRQTESLVQKAIETADAEPLSVVGRDGQSATPRRAGSEHLAALEQELRLALGTKVQLTHNARGRGKLVIHFSTHEEFERLRRHLVDPHPPNAQTEAG